MFKVKLDNSIKEFESLIEAKMLAILHNKQHNVLTEVLDNEGNVIFTKNVNEAYVGQIDDAKDINEIEQEIITKTPVEKIEKKLKNLDTEKYLKKSLDYLKKMKSNKQIKEDINEITIEEPLEAPTEAQITNAFESVIRNELSRLFLTIDEYNSDLATLQAEEVDEEVVNKLNYIIDDLNTHVGILQSCLTAIENKID